MARLIISKMELLHMGCKIESSGSCKECSLHGSDICSIIDCCSPQGSFVVSNLGDDIASKLKVAGSMSRYHE